MLNPLRKTKRFSRILRGALVSALVMTLLQGCMYANVIHPLDTDVDRTQLGTKVGRASSYCVLWLVAWGDSGVSKAAKNGDIETINHLDNEIEAILFGLYTRSTTIAYGD